ncbi:MAG TPA: signal peptidase I, partial [Pseudonocardiaceae bacterium]
MADLDAFTQPPSDDSEAGGNPEAGRARHRKRPPKKGSFWRELPILILTALVLTFLIQTFL